MNTPIIYALIGLVAGGIMMCFWQLGIAKGADAMSLTIASGIGHTLIGIVALCIQKQSWSLSPWLGGLGLAAGILGGTYTFAAMQALNLGGEGSTVFPVLSLRVLVATVLAFLIFREPVTATKLLGLGLGVSSIIVLSR